MNGGFATRTCPRADAPGTWWTTTEVDLVPEFVGKGRRGETSGDEDG